MGSEVIDWHGTKTLLYFENSILNARNNSYFYRWKIK